MGNPNLALRIVYDKRFTPFTAEIKDGVKDFQTSEKNLTFFYFVGKKNILETLLMSKNSIIEFLQ